MQIDFVECPVCATNPRLEELCPECATRLAASHPALARSAQWSVSPSLAGILAPRAAGLQNLCDCQIRMALAALVIAIETTAADLAPEDLLSRRIANARAALGWPK